MKRQMADEEIAKVDTLRAESSRLRNAMPTPMNCLKRLPSVWRRSRPSWQRSMSGQRCTIQITSPAQASVSTAVAGSACSAVTYGRKTRCRTRKSRIDVPGASTNRCGTSCHWLDTQWCRGRLRRRRATGRARRRRGHPPSPTNCELTAHRSLALREAVGNDPATVLHAPCPKVFIGTAPANAWRSIPRA